MTTSEIESKADVGPTEAETGPGPDLDLAKHLAMAQRSFALKDYSQAIDSYAQALDLLTQSHGDGSPESADVLVSYGKALLEYAISQSGVLGNGGEGEEAAEDEPAVEESGVKDPRFVFEDDARAGNVGAGATVQDTPAVAEEAEDEAEEEEDDFATAWQVLDLARVIYEKMVGDEARKKLGDVHVILGDVSLETENFTQAMADYRTALEILSSVLPPSSGQLAEAHYKLGLVLEYDTSTGARDECLAEMRRAIDSLQLRIDEIKSSSSKGKSAPGAAVDLDESAQKEVLDIEQMVKEIELKIEDVQATSVNKAAPTVLDEALDQALKGAVARMTDAGVSAGPVNDLTNLVKKRKKDVKVDVEVKGDGEQATLDPADAKKVKVDRPEL